jgi:hypothetical protein
MMIPNSEPSTLTIGDTWVWTKMIAGYPPGEGWMLSYVFAGPDRIEIMASIEGDKYKVLVDAAATANYKEGIYWGFGYVSRSTERYQIWGGTLTLLPNPAKLSALYDGRSHAKIVLDKINARLEGRMDDDVMNFSISDGGMSRALGLIPLSDLIRLKSQYEILVAQEEDQKRIAQGHLPKNKIKTRFIK